MQTMPRKELTSRVLAQGHTIMRRNDLLYPGESCRREWTGMRWLDPSSSGPDSDLAHLHARLAALHRDFPETRRCSVQDVCTFLRAARWHDAGQQRTFSAALVAPTSSTQRLSALGVSRQGHQTTSWCQGEPAGATADSHPQSPTKCSAGAEAGFGDHASLAQLAEAMEAFCDGGGGGGDRLPFLPPLIPSSSHVLYISSCCAAANPDSAPHQKQKAADGAGGKGGRCELDEVLRSRLLVAHCAAHFHALLSGAAAPPSYAAHPPYGRHPAAPPVLPCAAGAALPELKAAAVTTQLPPLRLALGDSVEGWAAARPGGCGDAAGSV